jgi:hypothetical protein
MKKIISRRAATASILLGPLAPTALSHATNAGTAAAQTADPAAVAKVGAAARVTDWREDYAYSLGIQAYIFGFPWIYLPTARCAWVTVPKPPTGITLRCTQPFLQRAHSRRRELPRWRRTKQRHALFDRLDRCEERAGHPLVSGDGLSLLYL